MRQIRFITSAIAWLLVLATALSRSFADGGQDDGTTMQPLQILDDCMEAVQAGDFERFVGHLSERELKMQAGLVLFLNSVMSPSPEDYEPEVFLLTRAMNDLVLQYTIPESQRSAGQHAVADFRKKLLGQAFCAALAAQDVPVACNPNTNSMGSMGIRESCINSAGTLRDPRAFLIAVLTEMARPTQISGQQAKEHKSIVDFAGMAKAYGQAEWTLYTRGNYALAVASVPEADAQVAARSPAQDAVNSGPAAEVTSPPSADNSSKTLRIEFRKIAGEWKVDRLLPASVLTPTFSASQPPTNSAPAPVYSGSPQSVPLPNTSAQPSPIAPGRR